MANRPLIRMKVPVSTLLEGARSLRSELTEEHKLAVLEYEKASKEFSKRVAKALSEAAKKAAEYENMEWQEEYYSGRYRDSKVTIKVGERPRKPDTISSDDIDRDIAILAATTEEHLTLTVEDHFARYLRAE